jgi:hypothetical protein
MLSLAHRRVIAGFVCLVVLLGWIDWQTSQPLLHQQNRTQSSNKTNEKPSGTDDPAIDVFTGILALATLILAWMAIRQSKDNRVVQRAHVFPQQPQHQFLIDQNGAIFGLRLWIPWKNSGVTPADAVNSLIGATWVQNPNDFQFGVVTQQGRQQPFVLGPTAEIASGTVDIGTPHINDLLIHRTGAQFFWGWARYQDAFQSTSRHVVEFCFRVTVEGQLGPPPFTGRVLFAFDGAHNRYYDGPA